jgi:hypothetical protein
MAQQINFFDPRYLRQKRAFSARALGQSVAVVAALLACASAVPSFDLLRTQRRVEQAARERGQLSAELARLEAESRRAPDPKLEAQARWLDAAIEARSQLVSRLNVEGSRENAGFTPYLEALARQKVRGVWLTSVRVDARSGALVLRGRALDPELLPAYLERIRRERHLQGQAFERLRMFAHDETESADAAGTRARKRRGTSRFVEFELGAAQAQKEAR